MKVTVCKRTSLESYPAKGVYWNVWWRHHRHMATGYDHIERLACMSAAFPRNGAHDVGGMVGLGPITIGPDTDEPVGRRWEGRALGTTIVAVVTGMLTAPTHRAVLEALHSVAYLSMNSYELWLYALEQSAVAAGVVTPQEIESRVARSLANPNEPMPHDCRPEILDGVRGLIGNGIPLGPVRLQRPPRFSAGDIVSTRRIQLEAPGRPHTRIPGYAQGRCGVIEMIHRPMLLEDVVSSGQRQFEYVYAVRIRIDDVWPAAAVRDDAIVVDLWESYLEDMQSPVSNEQEE
jgi:nitrile hydratase subunit beta